VQYVEAGQNVMPVAETQQGHDNGQTRPTDSSFLCAPAQLLTFSGHAFRLLGEAK
jgi:hypothetical protein